MGMPRILYGAIGTLGEGYVCRTPLGDPWVCHVYYGAIGTLGKGYARGNVCINHATGRVTEGATVNSYSV